MNTNIVNSAAKIDFIKLGNMNALPFMSSLLILLKVRIVKHWKKQLPPSKRIQKNTPTKYSVVTLLSSS